MKYINRELKAIIDFETIPNMKGILQHKINKEKWELIKQALTPPTADEVCEALQKYYAYGTVKYVEGNKEFIFTNQDDTYNITFLYGNTLHIAGYVPIPIIEMIAKFYKSELTKEEVQDEQV